MTAVLHALRTTRSAFTLNVATSLAVSRPSSSVSSPDPGVSTSAGSPRPLICPASSPCVANEITRYWPRTPATDSSRTLASVACCPVQTTSSGRYCARAQLPSPRDWPPPRAFELESLSTAVSGRASSAASSSVSGRSSHPESSSGSSALPPVLDPDRQIPGTVWARAFFPRGFRVPQGASGWGFPKQHIAYLPSRVSPGLGGSPCGNSRSRSCNGTRAIDGSATTISLSMPLTCDSAGQQAQTTGRARRPRSN